MLTELRAGLCLISLSLALLLPGPAAAIQRAAPQSTRVTSGASHVHSTGRSWGRYFAFSSPVDLTGQGSTASQVYVFSIVDYACQLGRPDLQIDSEEPVTCPNPPKPYLVKATDGTPADNISNPSVNETGTLVAFDAFGSFGGLCSGGATSRRQVFIKDLTTGKATAVTCSPDGDSYSPSLNAAGGAVTFTSTATFGRAPAGIPQVYVHQYASPEPRPGVGQTTPISFGDFARGLAPSGAPMLNKLGTHVVFESRANLLGDGTDSGVWNIFWFDRQLGRLFQVTNGNGDSRNAYVEEKRPGSVFFDSAATDLLGAISGPGGRQIYRADIGSAGTVPFLEQWTFGPGNSWGPAVEPNGGKVVFLSDGDHLLNGTTGARLFAIDFRDATRVLYQITGRGTVGNRIGASLGAWFVTFDSDDDVGGYGICGRQIWIITYDPLHETDAGHERIASKTLGLKPAEPPPGNRNASCSDGNGCTVDTCIGGQTCAFAERPDGSSCGEGDPCNGGTATCVAGTCQRDDVLVCDDNDKCTDDTCDPNTGCGHTQVDCDDANPCTDDTCDQGTGCAHTQQPGMQGVTCQNQQVRAGAPAQGNKQVLKNLRRAQRLIDQAARKKRKGQKRKLRQAVKLFNDVLPDISNDPQISREQSAELTQQIYGLLAQIGELLNDLQQKTGKGSK
jgi:Dictyostelium (slime mold) repeat